MRFKWLLISGVFGLGLFLLPFSYAPITVDNSHPSVFLVSIAMAQSENDSVWAPRNLWRSVMKQVNGVLDFTAQAIQAVGDAPSQLFDIESNNPPESPSDVQNFNPLINTDTQLPGLPAPQAYNGTLIINIPLQVSNQLSVGGVTRLTDLVVSGAFSITDLDVPGVATIGSLAAGGTQLSSLTVTGNTQLNTLSVSGPVSFANLTAGNLTVTNNLLALGGVTTDGADVDLQGGNIYAANIVNGIIAGDNIEITGTPDAPIISADIPSFGSRVRRINGLTGTLTIVAGTDIVVSESGTEITIDNDSDLATVAGRGGCTDCILDVDVIDALTILGGTIDDTVIGSSTPAAGTFSSLAVAGAQSLQYYDSDNSNFVGFRASSSIASDLVWTLPVVDGSADQFLFTDGNGNLRFDDVSVLGVVNDLPDLGDVTITALTAGDVLSYDGSDWVNVATSSFGLGDGTFLGLSDTPASYISNAVVVANAAGSSLIQSSNFIFDGSAVAIGTSTTATTLTIDGDVSLMGQSAIRYYEPNNGNYVGFQASSSLSGDTVWTLPAGDGSSDQVMVTDGSGNLRFADVSAIGGGVSSYLELNDTPGSFLNNAIPYVATSTIAFSSNLTYNGTTGYFGIGTNAPTDELTVMGSVYIGLDPSTPGISYNDLNNTVSIGTTVHEEKFMVSQGSILQRGGTSSEPYAPDSIGSLDLPDNAHAVTIVNDRAYVASRLGGTDFHIINIADKSAPTLIGSLGLPDSARQVSVRGNYAYVVTDSVGADFHVIDLTDPTSPTEVANLGLGTSATALSVRGRYAFVGTGNAAGVDFYVIDILTPTSPVIVGSINIGADINSVALDGQYAYIVTDTPSSIIAISISDPTSPTVVGTTAMTEEGSAIKVRGDYAYVTANSGGDDFFIFDIADPTSPTEIVTMNLASSANDVDISGRYAYVTTNGTGDDLHVIDIFSPTNPVEVGSVEMNTGSALGIQVRGRYAYIGSASTGNDFHVYDVTGVEAQSMLAHSLESGDLSVVGDIVASGDFSLSGGLEVGSGGLQSDGVLLIKDAGTSIITGNLAIGTTTSNQALSVAGDMRLTGHFYDSTNSSGTTGMVLQRTANGTQWVATSSLGIGGSSGTPTYGTDNQIPFINAGGTDYDYSANLTFDGSELVVTGDILPGANLTYDLGSSTARWDNIWAQTINIGTSTWSIFNGADGRLAFSNAAMQSGTEAFSILSNGNVGIGTTTPSHALSVAGLAYIAGIGTSTIEDNLHVRGNLRIGTSSLILSNNSIRSTGDLIFEAGLGSNIIFGNAGATTTLYADNQLGNVGIGTSTPTETLTVDGDMRLTGLFYDATGSAGNVGEVLQRTASGLAWVATSSLGISSGGGGGGGSSYNLGMVGAFATSSCPAGWVTADGSSVSTSGTYADLFGQIGYAYGGSGSSFNLPDYRGEFLRGWDNGAGTDPDAGSRTDRGDGTTGDNVGTKQADDYASHTHNYDSKMGSGGSRYLTNATYGFQAVSTLNQGTDASGGSETRPTNISVQYCISYADGGYGGVDLAENYPVNNFNINAGDIVIFDTEDPIVVNYATYASDKPLAGIISTQPGLILDDGQQGVNVRPVALAGRVPTKVNLEGGPIFAGDRITPSTQPGVGRKATPFEPSVGTAITDYISEDENEGDQNFGLVTVFIDLQEGFSTEYLTEVLFDEQLNQMISSATGSPMSVFVPLNEGDTLWRRLRDLATNFVDGVLSLIGLKTEFVETNKIQTAELCVDDVCVGADELRALLVGDPEPQDEVDDAGEETEVLENTEEVEGDIASEESTGTSIDENDAEEADAGTDSAEETVAVDDEVSTSTTETEDTASTTDMSIDVDTEVEIETSIEEPVADVTAEETVGGELVEEENTTEETVAEPEVTEVVEEIAENAILEP